MPSNSTPFLPCRKKVKHDTQWIAEMAIVDMRRKGREVSTLAPYRCEWCGWWHLGNPSEKWLERQRIIGARAAEGRTVRLLPWGPVRVGGEQHEIELAKAA